MHRRQDLYGTDSELFRPERWDEDLPLFRDPINAKWGYIPFGVGPRTCLGMDFALTEAAYTIVRLLNEFPTIALPGDEVTETGYDEVERRAIDPNLITYSGKRCA
ncbi:cytochrome P450 [Pyrenochaeta sp. DS3sAY3a]|nr:cytochrome P450 [Pyrenochaeta sp. DS3sAY3a]